MQDEEGVYFLKSSKNYTRSEAKAAVEKTYHFFKNKKETTPDTINDLLFLDKITTSFDRIENDVFSNQISLFFPNWVARFQTIQNRRLIESIISTHTPIHLKVNFHWLSIAQMSRFEKFYFAWLVQLQDKKATPESIDQKAFNLLKVLDLF